jgi:hypothetical protein
MKKQAASDLRRIPGVGPNLEEDLLLLGFRSVADLAKSDAEEMYERLCEKRGCHIDRCVLYVFREAVYFAGRKKHDPELLKWWNWSDVNLEKRPRGKQRKKVK